MPKYMHIANVLRNQIMSGEYVANQQLPLEKEFCELFSVSKMTVKKALDILVSEGLIIKRRGYGTFVKDLTQVEIQRLMMSRQFIGTSALYTKSEVRSKVINFTVDAAPADIAEHLNIEEGSFVYNIYRVRIVDGEPLAIEQTYMPIDVIPGLKIENVQGSIYEYIEVKLNSAIQSAHRKIRVRKATDFEANELGLELGDPVGIVEQTGYLNTGELFEYSFSIHKYDSFQIEFVLTRE